MQKVQGCRVQPLGVMRYLATASPAFVKRWFPDGVTAQALRRAPVLCFNRKDELQERFVRRVMGGRETGDAAADHCDVETRHVLYSLLFDQGRRSSLRHAARPSRSLTPRPIPSAVDVPETSPSQRGSDAFAAAIGVAGPRWLLPEAGEQRASAQ